jgi:hypothetical protein
MQHSFGGDSIATFVMFECTKDDLAYMVGRLAAKIGHSIIANSRFHFIAASVPILMDELFKDICLFNDSIYLIYIYIKKELFYFIYQMWIK